MRKTRFLPARGPSLGSGLFHPERGGTSCGLDMREDSLKLLFNFALPP
ncbi:hypothetical protein HMPREF1326_01598 [Akkermansia sp. KLE1605]|nr:hypothetical protein HMPREF1326_01598 [Akkermansia sp. KLE1605]